MKPIIFDAIMLFCRQFSRFTLQYLRTPAILARNTQLTALERYIWQKRVSLSTDFAEIIWFLHLNKLGYLPGFEKHDCHAMI